VKTLASLLAKRDALEVEIEEMRRAERAAVLKRVREAVFDYQLTADEVFFKAKATPKPKATAKPAAAKKKVKAKPAKPATKRDPADKAVKGQVYTDGVHVWRGAGYRPRWLVDYLHGRPVSVAVKADNGHAAAA